MSKSKYVIKLWNGKYGNSAKFIVMDTTSKKYSEYAPTRPGDVAWVIGDITGEPEYKSWESFEDEPVDDLSSIVF